MERTRVSTGTDWERRVGYSRAVRVGDHVHVSGTTATDEDGILIGKGDPAAQARRTLRNIETALAQTEASMDDVVRTRIYVTDVDHWEAVGEVHGEIFAGIRPATSLLVVRDLIKPELLVEIEATAILD